MASENSLAQLYDDYMDGIQVIEIDGVKESFDDYQKRMGGIDYESKAHGGSVGIEILFKEKMKDGGRAGFFMGGPALEGEALSIYNSMNAYGNTDQQIADKLQSLGMYTPPGSTPDTPDTTPGQTIGYQGGNDSPYAGQVRPNRLWF